MPHPQLHGLWQLKIGLCSWGIGDCRANQRAPSFPRLLLPFIGSLEAKRLQWVGCYMIGIWHKLEPVCSNPFSGSPESLREIEIGMCQNRGAPCLCFPFIPRQPSRNTHPNGRPPFGWHLRRHCKKDTQSQWYVISPTPTHTAVGSLPSQRF